MFLLKTCKRTKLYKTDFFFLKKIPLKQSGCEMLNFLRMVSYDNRLRTTLISIWRKHLKIEIIPI